MRACFSERYGVHCIADSTGILFPCQRVQTHAWWSRAKQLWAHLYLIWALRRQCRCSVSINCFLKKDLYHERRLALSNSCIDASSQQWNQLVLSETHLKKGKHTLHACKRSCSHLLWPLQAENNIFSISRYMGLVLFVSVDALHKAEFQVF